MVKKSEIVSNANSAGLILDFYSTGSNFARKSDFDLRAALQVIKNDPVVKGSIISLVDKILETPFQVVGVDKRSKRKEVESKLKELRFEKVLRQAIFNMILYGNAFIEIVKQKGKVTDLNILETIHMDIKSDDHGDIIRYEQTVGKNDESSVITWVPDQVIHLKLTEITTNVWGEVDIQSIYDTVIIKDLVREWIKWFFKTNQARGFYNIKNANAQKVKDFLTMLKKNESDVGKPVIAQGEVDYQILRNFSQEGATLSDLMSWCDQQILILLQVPPIVVGMSDQSGRGNSVEQYKSLFTKVRSIQKQIEEMCTFELLPKMGYAKVTFEYGSIDDHQMLEKLNIVKLMKDSGFTNEAIEEWMRENDLFFETAKVFNDPMDMMLPGAGPAGQDEDTHDKKKLTDDEPNKLRSKVSTRENQLVSNAIIEPSDQWKEFVK